MTENQARMGVFEHLEELRSRLMKAVLAILLGFLACVYFGNDILEILSAPLNALLPEDTSMVYTGLPDPFFMRIKVSFVAGVFLTIPYVLYQIWQFIAPGLYSKEKKLAAPFVAIATVLFYIGGCFAYFLVFPVVFEFFITVAPDGLKPMISIREFVSLILKLMLAFGVIFETPVIIVFLGLLGLVTTDFLRKGRRYFIVLAFVLGAVLSPPDVVSQIMMGVPLLVLYEASIHILAVIEKRKRKEQQEWDADLLDGVDESDSLGTEDEK